MMKYRNKNEDINNRMCVRKKGQCRDFFETQFFVEKKPMSFGVRNAIVISGKGSR